MSMDEFMLSWMVTIIGTITIVIIVSEIENKIRESFTSTER
jgi:uncharacterized membrane protein